MKGLFCTLLLMLAPLSSSAHCLGSLHSHVTNPNTLDDCDDEPTTEEILRKNLKNRTTPLQAPSTVTRAILKKSVRIPRYQPAISPTAVAIGQDPRLTVHGVITIECPSALPIIESMRNLVAFRTFGETSPERYWWFGGGEAEYYHDQLLIEEDETTTTIYEESGHFALQVPHSLDCIVSAENDE